MESSPSPTTKTGALAFAFAYHQEWSLRRRLPPRTKPSPSPTTKNGDMQTRNFRCLSSRQAAAVTGSNY
nr:hypothetical protein Itr_chr14CG05430 [Ipomoea trifida]